MFQRLTILISVIFLASCAEKQPAPVSSYQDLPTIKMSQVKTNPVYKYILGAEYDLFQERDESATKSLEAALKEDPTSNYLKTHLAYQYAKGDNVNESIRLLEEVIAAKPDDLEALFLYARILATKNEFDKSKATFLKILDLPEVKQDMDKRAEVSFILSSIYIERGELLRAEELLKKIVAENPEHLLAYYYLGRVYSEQNQMKQAIATYKQAVEIDPRFSLGWRALGLIYEYFDKTDEALAAYEKVFALETLNVDARTKLIDLYMKKNEPKKAIEQIAIIKKMYPNVPDVSIRLGLFYYQEKMFKEAETEFTDAIKKYKNNTDLYYYLGLTQYQLKKTQSAENNFSKVDSDADIYPVSQLALATLHEESGQKEKAEKVLRKGVQKIPASVDLRVGLANYKIRNKQYEEAQKILEEGLAISPKEERFHLSLAEIFERRKQYTDLEKTINALLAMNPNNASALNFLGYSYADRNIKLKEAEELIQKALTIKPNDAFIQDSMGWVYYQKKDFKRAEEMIRKALSTIPDEPIILEHLGDTLHMQGKTKEARDAYQKALEFNKEQEKRGTIEQKIKKLSN